MRIAYPQVLWRMLFALPLPIIAAYLCYLAVEKIQSVSVSKTVLKVVSITPLFFLLITFEVGRFSNLMAKSPSLGRTLVENSFRHWEDMLSFLQNMSRTYSVLTDPSTGYLIRSLTKHDHDGFKFYKKNYIEFNFDDFSSNPLSQYKGRLLVINLRNGAINSKLKRPYHIYPDIMNVEKHYSNKLLQEVRQNPERYKPIWNQDRISIYEII